MGEELQFTLCGLISPERLDQLTAVNDALEELNYYNHHLEITQAISLTEKNGDSDLMVGRIVDALTVAVWDCLAQLGIEVADAPISEYVPILETATYWDQYVLPETLHGLVESTDDDIEAFAVVVNEITSHPTDEVIETLQFVNPRVTKKILENTSTVAEERELLDQRSLVEIRNKSKLINQAIYQAPRKTTLYLVQQLAKEGVVIGTPLTDLLSRVIETLDQTSLKYRGWELLTLYLYSDSELKQGPFYDLLNEYFESSAERIQIQAYLSDFVSLNFGEDDADQ